MSWHPPIVAGLARRPECRQHLYLPRALPAAWARKSPTVAGVLPLLYLSSGDFGPVLEQFLGSAAGLSASTVVRLTEQWQAEAAAFTKRSLTDVDYV